MSAETESLVQRAHEEMRNSIKARAIEASVNLGLSEKTVNDAIKMIDSVDPNWLVGRRPTAMAASAIFASIKINGSDATQTSVKREMGVAMVTIRERHKVFLDSVEMGACS